MNKKLLHLIFILSLTFLSAISVEAKEVAAKDIEGNSYVIGTHIFTGNTTLTTSHIMLAAKTIENSNIEDMVIYYKNPRGRWINGATGENLIAPETFKINYTDLKLEEENDTVLAPDKPIISLYGGPTGINEEDVLKYSVGIYVDDIENLNNKVDGVEFKTYCSDGCSNGTEELTLDLKLKNFSNIVTSEYAGEGIEANKHYHLENVSVNTTITDYLTIYARAYAEDGNGKRIYSESTLITLDVDDHLPYVQIINNYSNPEYIEHGDYYIYTLGIDVPDADAYTNPHFTQKFAYITNCADGRFGLYDNFTLVIPKGTVKTCYAQLGYYDKNSEFKFYLTGNDEQKRKYFTIDTRTLTAPILYANQEGISFADLKQNGEYLRINSNFYKEQEKDTLDYQMEGTEIYRVYSRAGEPVYELIEGSSGTKHVFTPTGSAYYTARVYATNEEGKKVYSDFSEIVTVIRTPEIEVSEIIDGKVNVSIVNTDDYSNPFKFNVYTWDSTVGEVFLDSFSLTDGQISIDVTENTKIYVRAYDKDYQSSGIGPVYVYSAPSNEVDVVVK